MAAYCHKSGRIQIQLLAQLRTQVTADGAGLIDLGEDVLGDAQGFDGFPIPILGGGIIQLGGGGDGVLRTLGTGEEIAQQVRGQQQRIGSQQRTVLFTDTAVQLVQSVEGEGSVDAGAAVENLGGDLLLDCVDVLLGAQTVGAGNTV